MPTATSSPAHLHGGHHASGHRVRRGLDPGPPCAVTPLDSAPPLYISGVPIVIVPGFGVVATVFVVIMMIVFVVVMIMTVVNIMMIM
jgi:hypothetical protein